MSHLFPESELRTDLSDAELLLRRLTGSLAHNLNNRLTVVLGCLELSLQELDESSPVRSHLRLGLASALQAADLVRRMITFACRPTGLPNTSVVLLDEMARHVAERLRERQLPKLKVELHLEPAVPARGNPVLVQLAFDQLVDNAVEAMPEGGTISLHVFEDADTVCLSIRDTGPGFSEQAASHLFEPFLTTRCAGHLGLGLVLCRDLVESMGGSVVLTWEKGKGSTATLRLPPDREGAPVSAGRERARPSSSENLWHVI